MIYLDNAATTPPAREALARAELLYSENFFNPSARYGGGFAVQTLLAAARQSILAQVADINKFELIFTSGGTESDNQAIFGSARRGNAVTTAGEHAAVERSFTELKNRGVESRFAPVTRDGSVDVERLLSLVDEKTSLVSVVHVNNETGAINDVAAIARLVKQKNPRTLFHADGVQAFGKIPVRLTPEIDLYSISAHKVGGLKGTGALIKRKGFVLPPLIFGGGQENTLRSGTENVLGILDFAYAAEALTSVNANKTLCELLWELLDKDVFVRISPTNGSPYILTVSAAGTRGEVVQRMLYDNGVCVGTGSACSSKNRFSRVITACGHPEPVLDGVLRVSFSPSTTEEEVRIAAAKMNEAVRKFKDKV